LLTMGVTELLKPPQQRRSNANAASRESTS
jgi:hypothetical protein